MSDYIFTKTPSKIRKVNTKNITIKTSLPAKGTKDFFLDLQKYESRSMHGQIPIIWKKASNFNTFIIDSREDYLRMTRGRVKEISDGRTPNTTTVLNFGQKQINRCYLILPLCKSHRL